MPVRPSPWAIALVLGGVVRLAAAEPVQDLAPAPLPVGARLLPCAVELEHTFRAEDDVTWSTRRVPVWAMVREWEHARWQVDFASRIVIAPIPLTVAQARALLPDAREERYDEHYWIAAHFGENDFAYWFDAAGRTVKVDWDPVADSSVYVFHYRYDCAEGMRPFYADDAQ